MNRRKMLLSTLGSTLAVNGVSIAAASTPPLFQRESLPQEFSKVISPGKLRILVLSGSPHKDGTTNLLATNFVKGAKEAGHEVRRVNTSFEDINACRGCFFCLKNSGQCLIRDDVPAILHLIEQADVVIFVIPIYYYAIHSSLKALLERFTSRRTDFMKMPKKMGLIAVCGGKFEWSFDSINAHFDSLSRYLGWKDIGRIEARGYPTKTDIQKTEYPKLAYQFGFNLS